MLENYNSILLVSATANLAIATNATRHGMLNKTDTSLSSTETVIQNIYSNFTMAAMRSVSYLLDIDYLAQGNIDAVISQ